MKKIILALLFVTGLSAQTTEIEYNYLTKGYKETVTKGLDLKQGYELQDFWTQNDFQYQFDFKLFINTKTKKNAAILVVAHSITWDNCYYLCIPLNNPDLYQRYKSDLKLWDASMLSSYSSCLSILLSSSLNQ